MSLGFRVTGNCQNCSDPIPNGARRLFCSSACETEIRMGGRRHCRWCETPLVARDDEKTHYFLERSFCNKSCSNEARTGVSKPMLNLPVRVNHDPWLEVGKVFEDHPTAIRDSGTASRLVHGAPNKSLTGSTAAWTSGDI